MKSVVIIGASHAAAEAATTLRRKGWKGRILIIGYESSFPYHKPPLSKAYFSNEIEEAKLDIKAKELYERNEIEFLFNTKVTAINRAEKFVETEKGEKINYNKLIIATGASVRKLQIKGADLPNVFYLRSKKDVDNIKANLKKESKILVIGAGYIGLEVAASATKLNHKVTVVEAADKVLARVTCPTISDFYKNYHEAKGVEFKFSTFIKEIESIDNQLVANFDNGEKLHYDICIIGIGVIPNTFLAENCGLKCDDGIVVNEFTQTEDENIYAVGDCSKHPNLRYNKSIRLESVPNAMSQGKTAAFSICGEPKIYDELPWFWSDQYDLKLQTVGLFNDYNNIIKRKNEVENSFAVYYFKDEKLIACDAVNSPRDYISAKKMIENKVNPKKSDLENMEIPIKELVAELLKS